MTTLELRSLRAGDLVQDPLGDLWVVTAPTVAGCIAVRTVFVTDAAAWELVASTLDVQRRTPRVCPKEGEL